MNTGSVWDDLLLMAAVRHEDELQAAANSNKTELSRLSKELEVTKKTLSQQKMNAESLNSQVQVISIICFIILHSQEQEFLVIEELLI